MKLRELIDKLTAAAVIFSNGRLVNEILPQITGQNINEESVKNFVLQFLAQVELPTDVMEIMEKNLNDYAKDSLSSIKRNHHMNDYKRGNTFDKISAEAILVDFINYACRPVDLAFYTRDLIQKVTG